MKWNGITFLTNRRILAKFLELKFSGLLKYSFVYISQLKQVFPTSPTKTGFSIIPLTEWHGFIIPLTEWHGFHCDGLLMNLSLQDNGILLICKSLAKLHHQNNDKLCERYAEDYSSSVLRTSIHQQAFTVKTAH